MQYNSKSLTRDGATIFAQADATKKALIVDKLVVSERVIPEGTDISTLSLNDFTNAKQFDANNVSQSNNTFTVTSVVSNEGLTKDFSLSMIGVMGHIDGDTTQKILAVALGIDPFVLPADQGTPFRFLPSVSIGYSASQNVELQVNDDVYITQKDIDSILASKGYVTQEKLDELLPDDIARTGADNKFTGANSFEKPITMQGKTVATTADVNAKQDKIGYTPADDSKVSTLQTQVNNSAVGTNLLLGTATPASITGNASGNQVARTYDLVGGMNAYNLYQKYGSWFTLSYDWSVTDTASAYTGDMQQQFYGNPWGFGDITTISSSNTSGHKVTTFTLSNSSSNKASFFDFHLNNVPTTSKITVSNMKLEKGSVATDWCPNPSEILTESDDSKVAHLSGANNFDTVPTVKNNPLLLASSLPSDLARKGQDANFTGKLQKSGVDVATAADLSSYITKDQLTAILKDYIKVDPNTGFVNKKVNFHYGDAMIEGHTLGWTEWVYDEATAKAQTALYPANIYLVGDKPSTTGGAS